MMATRRPRPRLGSVLTALLFFVMIVVGSVFAVGTTLDAQNRRTSELAACHRVQRLRDQVNRNAAIEYLVLTAAARSIQHVQPALAQQYLRYATATRYTGPTNCHAAVDHPGEYKPPPPVRSTVARALRIVLTTGR